MAALDIRYMAVNREWSKRGEPRHYITEAADDITERDGRYQWDVVAVITAWCSDHDRDCMAIAYLDDDDKPTGQWQCYTMGGYIVCGECGGELIEGTLDCADLSRHDPNWTPEDT